MSEEVPNGEIPMREWLAERCGKVVFHGDWKKDTQEVI